MARLDRSKWFTKEEVRDILTKLEDQDANDNLLMILKVAFSTGCRATEILNLNVGDVRNKSHADVLAKGKKLHRVPFNESIQSHIKLFLGCKESKGHDMSDCAPLFVSNFKKRLSYQTVVKNLKRWAEKINIPKLSNLHKCRHSFLTQVCNNPKGGVVMAKFLANHANIKTTSVYLHATDEQLREAAEIASF